MNRVKKVLDKNFKRVIQTYSANWGGLNVWAVSTSDGILNAVEGCFIQQDDDNNFILLHRTEMNEETEITDVYVYNFYDNIGTLKELLTISKSI